MDGTALIKEAGPYTAPLCAAMAYALRWMAARWAAAELEKKELQKKLDELRDSRAIDLVQTAKEHAEIGEATRTVQREQTAAINAVLKSVRGE